jgi:Mn-dependent DtxR family transcriptional regulator
MEPATTRDFVEPAFTPKQGQYLSFIYYYIKLNRIAPAEADFARYFQVSAPAVHQMIKKLEADGWISRTPGQARSIKLRVARDQLPDLE